MKKQILFAVLLLVSMSAAAQEWDHEYRPFVEEGKHWNYIHDVAVIGGPKEYNYLYSYVLKGDSLINDIPCKKIYKERDEKTTYMGAMYEKDAKIFLFPVNETKEGLLYDFSLKRGETITIEISQTTILCKDIKLSTYEGIERKIILYIPIDNSISEEDKERILNMDDDSFPYWIEGIGSPTDLIGNIDMPGNYNHLFSCNLNGKTLFRDGYYSNIHNAVNTPFSSDNLFDLQGRPLSTPPSRGMYIQNGKKVIK